ncbi:NUDIX hydrolase [Leptolinea sp. HRD-7]|nr:NUDIX hydrolase [Leptolinea sp. HRD-7]
MTEHVMVVNADAVNRLPAVNGFSRETAVLPELLKHARFIERAAAETDETYKQVIPYSILKYRDEYFFYMRTKAVSEKRLSLNYSLGVGGHINPEDGDFDPADAFAVIDRARGREISEEFDCRLKPAARAAGLINDNTSAVSRVHLGIVYEYELLDADVKPRETLNFESLGFAGVKELHRRMDAFENWSRILITQYLAD